MAPLPGTPDDASPATVAAARDSYCDDPRATRCTMLRIEKYDGV
jgi:hypothetical protein